MRNSQILTLPLTMLVALFLYFALWEVASCSRSFVISIDTLRYEYNSNFIKTMTLTLSKYDRRMKINGSFSFVGDVREFNMINWIQIYRPNGKWVNLYNTSLEGCKFLDESLARMNPIIDGIHRNIKKYVINLPSNCPIKKDTFVLVNKFYLDENLFPPFIPNLNWSSFFGITIKNQYAYKVYTTGHSEQKIKEIVS
ncbi:uncharacterized protein LOC142230085 isoform X1 [Haematobia irritans]|uniref:uncharacterized protein LOC142230085 isoform X1 n=1 Tax=Haematobia irritans TaxID=7368 RepID=UPI003F5089DD